MSLLLHRCDGDDKDSPPTKLNIIIRLDYIGVLKGEVNPIFFIPPLGQNWAN